MEMDPTQEAAALVGFQEQRIAKLSSELRKNGQSLAAQIIDDYIAAIDKFFEEVEKTFKNETNSHT